MTQQQMRKFLFGIAFIFMFIVSCGGSGSSNGSTSQNPAPAPDPNPAPAPDPILNPNPDPIVFPVSIEVMSDRLYQNYDFFIDLNGQSTAMSRLEHPVASDHDYDWVDYDYFATNQNPNINLEHNQVKILFKTLSSSCDIDNMYLLVDDITHDEYTSKISLPPTCNMYLVNACSCRATFANNNNIFNFIHTWYKLDISMPGCWAGSKASDGNYVFSTSMDNSGAALLKLGQKGETIWHRENDPLLADLIVNPDTGAIVGIGVEGDDTISILGYDSNGNLEFEKNYGDPYKGNLLAIANANDGSYIATGRYWDQDSVHTMVSKFTTNGDLLWFKKFNFASKDLGLAIASTPDNEYMIVGYKADPNSLYFGNAYLLKIDSDGNIIWRKDYNSLQVQDTPTSAEIKVTSKGEILFSAYDRVVKTDSNGNILWEIDSAMGVRGFELTPDNGCIVTGLTGAYGGIDIPLLKLDTYGNVEWNKRITWGGSAIAQTIMLAEDGGYVIGGVRSGSFLAIKTDELGWFDER